MPEREFGEYMQDAAAQYGRFSHAAHLYLTWHMLHDLSALEALSRIRAGIQGVAQASGHPGKYHETLTVAWLLLVLERLDRQEDWEAFAARNPDLFDAGYIHRYYAKDVLDSVKARQTFVVPSLPLPGRWAVQGR